MKEWIRKDIAAALEGLSKAEYEELAKAWLRTVAGKRGTERTRKLIPFIGSGLSGNPVHGWTDLVKAIERVAPVDWTKHHWDSAALSYPQRLEILLARIGDQAKESVAQAFEKMFNQTRQPTSLHQRLVRLFPRLATTNYNDLLSSVTDAPEAIDLTDRDSQGADEYRLPRAIIHLHGLWPRNASLEEKVHRIFAGVGRESERVDHREPDALGGPVLVLTENQYHRLYRHSWGFQRAVQRLFAGDHLLLFLGSGLTPAELGIQTHLRDLQLFSSQTLVGVYVGFDINPAKVAALQAQGLAIINLPGCFGWQPEVQDALLHALLDEFSDRFGDPRPAVVGPGTKVPESATSVSVPEVVCVGVAARQVIIALKKKPKIEASYGIPDKQYCEEPGGQHLWPALYLASRGRRVAIATRLGDDSDADWVLAECRRLVVDRGYDGDLDTQLIIRKGRTRVTFAITYPRNVPNVGDCQVGTRTLYDYEGAAVSGEDWLATFDADELSNLQRKVRRFKDTRAIYLSPHGADLQHLVLEELGGRVELRFFETGTTGLETGTTGGPSLNRAKSIASRCTHVLASAEFVYNVLEQDPNADDYQEALANDFQGLLARAYREIFNSTRACLIATLGPYGAAYVEAGQDAVLVEPEVQNRQPQICWFGCGDMFRAAFIDATLNGASVHEACSQANAAAYDRTTRLHFLS